MLRKSLLALAASVMTLSTFTGTIAVMDGGSAPAASAEVA